MWGNFKRGDSCLIVIVIIEFFKVEISVLLIILMDLKDFFLRLILGCVWS